MTKDDQIREKLQDVIDPELRMSIIDLGLVYNVTHKKGKVHILMTLTSMGCPLYDTIEQDVYETLESLGFKEEDITIELTFDPPWSMDRMSERGKAMLGI